MNDDSFMSASGRPRAPREGNDKRRRILDAAVKVFARKGYFGARVSDIARRAGVADGTVYLYFHNKEDVLACLFEDVMSEHIAQGREELRRQPSGAERLRIVAEHHLKLLGSNPDLAVVFQVELRQSTKFMERFTASSFQDYLKLIDGIIEESQREGSLRPDLPRKFLAKALFGILDEMVTSWILGGRDYDLGKLAAPVVDLFLNGARARASTATRGLRVASGRGGRPA
jgi:TetR/AcrR family transcriptional regulator, fatty acid metabolism regulator protein